LNTHKFTWAILLSAILAGCVGPLVDVQKVDDTTAVQLNDTMKTFDVASTPATAKVLGPITATSCKNKMWDKDATAEDATTQLKLLSRQRGGNAVGNLSCGPVEGTDLSKNCWQSVVCTGTAIDTNAPTLTSAAKRKRPSPK
jgi:hypothetical protein